MELVDELLKWKILIDNITSKIALTETARRYVMSIGKIRKVRKGEMLIRQGQQVNYIFFVTGGCLRSYCTDKSGREHTLQFAVKDWWISDYIAIFNNTSAQLTVECLRDSTVIQFTNDDSKNLLLEFTEFEMFQRKNLERHVVSLQKRILNQLQLTARERYELFVREYPDIEAFVPNYHIASYLGITQESLSRIRVENSRG